jgi:hypothetical protein
LLSSVFLCVLCGERVFGLVFRERLRLSSIPHHIRIALRGTLQQVDQRVGALAQGHRGAAFPAVVLSTEKVEASALVRVRLA